MTSTVRYELCVTFRWHRCLSAAPSVTRKFNEANLYHSLIWHTESYRVQVVPRKEGGVGSALPTLEWHVDVRVPSSVMARWTFRSSMLCSALEAIYDARLWYIRCERMVLGSSNLYHTSSIQAPIYCWEWVLDGHWKQKWTSPLSDALTRKASPVSTHRFQLTDVQYQPVVDVTLDPMWFPHPSAALAESILTHKIQHPR